MVNDTISLSLSQERVFISQNGWYEQKQRNTRENSNAIVRWISVSIRLSRQYCGSKRASPENRALRLVIISTTTSWTAISERPPSISLILTEAGDSGATGHYNQISREQRGPAQGLSNIAKIIKNQFRCHGKKIKCKAMTRRSMKLRSCTPTKFRAALELIKNINQ